MRESMFESLVGAAVIAVAGVFLWFAIDRGGEASAGPDRYELTARFNNISGIDRGADVRIAGVKAGVVKAIDGDPKRFEAVLTMSLDKKWALPDDGWQAGGDARGRRCFRAMAVAAQANATRTVSALTSNSLPLQPRG